ncbi:MAG: 3'-5' exonuclease [Nitrospinae bacterium]|nr:3'-5' exonuclease [Nitrospinota bacterium]
MKLIRPIIFFDLETTGVNVHQDRIVEIATVKIDVDGSRQTHSRRVNPTIPIPKEASDVHGITDEMVKEEKPFTEIAPQIFSYFEGCDIGGFNVIGYDLPLLKAEFKRAGIDYNTEDVKIADMMQLYHQRVKRNLSAAYRYYCGKSLENAHSAKADIEATAEIFDAQIKEYDDLTDMNAFHELSYLPFANNVDSDGKFVWNDKDEVVLNFGKNKNEPLALIATKNPSFLKWMMNADFSDETKTICRDALNGVFPQKKK